MKKFLFTFSITILALLTIHLAQKKQHTEEVKTDKISGAFQAIQMVSAANAYPNGEIPGDKYVTEFEKAKSQMTSVAQRSSVEPWEEMGPWNTAGRTIAVAYNHQNPNTLYCGTASGGLWRSYQFGQGTSWHYVPLGTPVLGVSSIEIHPVDTNIMLIGTGEVYNADGAGTGGYYRPTRGSYGVGILKTRDGGASWTKTLDWSLNNERGVWAVRYCEGSPDIMYAATTIGTHKSIDGGDTWTQVHDVIMGNDVVIHPTNPDIAFVASGNLNSAGKGIYRTTDGGDNWDFMNDPDIPTTFGGKIQLDLHEADPNIVYASIGNSTSGSTGATWLVRTLDGGDNWELVTNEDYSKWQGWFAHDVVLHPDNPDELMTIGINIWKSTNGGFNINQQSGGGVGLGTPPIGEPDGGPNYVHSDAHDIQYIRSQPDTIIIGSDGGVFLSLDGGETFASANGALQTSQFYNGFNTAPLDTNLALGGLQDNSTVIYRGNKAWQRAIGGDGSWSAINSTDPDIMYGSWQNLNVLKTLDGALSDFPFSLNIPSGGSTAFIAPYVVSHSNPDIIYAGRGTILKSTNAGDSWITTNGGNELNPSASVYSMEVSPSDPDVLYATTAWLFGGGISPTVHVTQDGGVSYDDVSAGLPDRIANDVTVDPNDPATAYVTFAGFGTGHIFKTTNYGDTWKDITGTLPDVPTNAVIVDPESTNHIYVGNDLGIYFSEDGGTIWQDYNTGILDAMMVFDLKISNANRKLRVASHGKGAWQRDLVFEVIVGIDDPATDGSTIGQNFPNPFRDQTSIPFVLVKRERVTLAVYDIQGKLVRTLLNNKSLGEGEHFISFDGKDQLGSTLASGNYVYTITVDDKKTSKTFILQ